MRQLPYPKKGDPISHEWGEQVVDLINHLLQGPEVVAPLAKMGGSIHFADNYQLRLVQTASTITARSGTTMGTGQVKFETSAGGTLADAPGNIVRNVRSILGNTVNSGQYGYVAWVNGEWHLIAADCA